MVSMQFVMTCQKLSIQHLFSKFKLRMCIMQKECVPNIFDNVGCFHKRLYTNVMKQFSTKF